MSTSLKKPFHYFRLILLNNFFFYKDFFSTSKDIVSTQNAEGAELKSVANNSKNMFQQILVKKLKHILLNTFISEYII